ncbi:hypothetical protein FHT86_006846 [Rhizobium sp. BK313]|uniref:hypothetical protein n=1 Tax=Rhizobium sp. BK313 TaxID=2587081 RepID=UPI0010D5E88B|nr:hypothetical protein [Rhizobium sp. BK313]MBB3458520.1 hypothetical protein [Rhizobium sp. BK313]
MSSAIDTPGFGLTTSSVLRVALIQSAVVFVVAALWQQRWGTIVDTSWLISEAERVLDGERLYVDVIDNNPPFSIWLFLPAIVLSRWAGIAPEIGVYLYTCLAVIVGLGLSALIVRRAGFSENHALLRLLPLFVALFMIFPGNAFTERDHVGTVLFLPLLAIMALRANTTRRVKPGIALIVGAGLCGSILVLVKAYYVVAYIVPALYVAWRRRNLWLLLAPENCIIGIVGVIYVALIFWLTPEFMRDLFPQVVDIYMKARDPLRVALSYAPIYLMIILLFRMVAPKAPVTPLCAVTLLASLAAVAPLIYQGKGWGYHAFAAISLAFAAVLCRTAASSGWRYNRETLGRVVLCAIVVVFASQPFLPTQKPAEAFVAAIKAASKGEPTLGVIGSDIAAAHPLDRIVGARFLSANNSDWLGALAFVLAQEAAARGEAADAARYQNQSDAYLDAKYAEFARHNYDLIVVQQDEPLWTDHVFGQARFAALLSAYHPIARDERFIVYGRNAPADQSSKAR